MLAKGEESCQSSPVSCEGICLCVPAIRGVKFCVEEESCATDLPKPQSRSAPGLGWGLLPEPVSVQADLGAPRRDPDPCSVR